MGENKISGYKWQNILKENEDLSIVLDIRDEIIYQMEIICYEQYIERQTKNFIIHCAYLAWCDIIKLNFLKRDNGEGNVPDSVKWQPDEEPLPSLVDPWSEQTLPILDNIPDQILPQLPVIPDHSVKLSIESLVSGLEEISEEDTFFSTFSTTTDSEDLGITLSCKSAPSSYVSIFSGIGRPSITWLTQRKLEIEQMRRQMDITAECLITWRKRRYIPGEVVPQQVLSASKLPTHWVDIKCTVVPAQPYQMIKRKNQSKRPVVIRIK